MHSVIFLPPSRKPSTRFKLKWHWVEALSHILALAHYATVAVEHLPHWLHFFTGWSG